MNSHSISIDQAKKDKLFYVVANIAIVNVADRSCLLLKRSENEKVLGGRWAFPGGKLEHSDITTLLVETGNKPIDGIDNILGKLVQREGKEECGLEVSPKTTLIIRNKVFVRPDNVPVFMTTLATSYLGGTVKMEDGAFSEYAWVTTDQLAGYDCIDGVRNEAASAIDSVSSK